MLQFRQIGLQLSFLGGDLLGHVGTLGVQLGGAHEYFGKTVVKPTIGDDTRPPEPQDIQRLNRLMFATAGLMLAILLIVTKR